MPGHPNKDRMPKKYLSQLGRVQRTALVEAKNDIKLRGPKAGDREFRNTHGLNRSDGSPLPKLDAGFIYREFRAGLAHKGDLKSAGKFRFVFQIHVCSWIFSSIYYTDAHYDKETFFKLV
jgi:hypothetical protein